MSLSMPKIGEWPKFKKLLDESKFVKRAQQFVWLD